MHKQGRLDIARLLLAGILCVFQAYIALPHSSTVYAQAGTVVQVVRVIDGAPHIQTPSQAEYGPGRRFFIGQELAVFEKLDSSAQRLLGDF